jgi:hypothetical protein
MLQTLAFSGWKENIEKKGATGRGAKASGLRWITVRITTTLV